MTLFPASSICLLLHANFSYLLPETMASIRRTSKAPHRVSLQRALSKLGYCSRSKAASVIRSGKVAVNNMRITNPHQWVDLRADKIEIEGQPLKQTSFRYVLFHKPKGVLTSSSDEGERKTIYDVLPPAYASLRPVGRLDKDTSGLLLLTNDHQFAHVITDPVSHIPKTYEVVLKYPLTHTQVTRLSEGIPIVARGQQYIGRALAVQLLLPTVLHITIDEGKNRQVRRMIKAVDGRVKELKRIAIGTLTLGSLEVGKYRELTPSDIELLVQTKKLF